jgi:adenylate kinase
VRLVLLGPPGAGKGTQAQALVTRYGIPQISSGDLLRAVVREDSDLGREAAGYMDRGKLVPDEFVLKLIADRFRKKDARGGFILDGFPRNVSQAEALGTRLDRAGLKLDKVVAVMLPDNEVLQRITGRRTCRNCAAMYHVVFEPPAKPGICDKCGGELYQREDDREDTVRERIKVYHAMTQPLLDYYQRLGLLAKVDGKGRPDEVEKRIFTALAGISAPSQVVAGSGTPGS